jgi:hypothetical protein
VTICHFDLTDIENGRVASHGIAGIISFISFIASVSLHIHALSTHHCPRRRRFLTAIAAVTMLCAAAGVLFACCRPSPATPDAVIRE